MKNTFYLFVLIFVLQSQIAFAACRIDTTYNYTMHAGSSTKTLVGRTIYTYNSHNKEIITLRQSWSSGSWSTASKDSFIYINDTILKYRSSYSYNISTSTITGGTQKVISYSSNFKHIITTDYNLNISTSLWVPNYETDVTLNAFGLDSIYIYKDYNSTTSALENSQRALSYLTIGATNKTYRIVSYSWNAASSSWNNEAEFVWIFQNHPTLDITLDSTNLWNSTTSTWEPYIKKVNTYNPLGFLTSYLAYRYDAILGWDYTSRGTYLYAGNNLAEVVYQNFDGSNWINSERELYLYNAANKEVEATDYDWNTTTSIWDPSSRTRKIYNASNELIEVSNETGWNDALSRYNFNYIYEYKCTFYNVGILELNDSKFSIYPNPLSSNQFTIDLPKESEVQIIDLQGKVVFKNHLEAGENKIEVPALQNGIYFVRVGNSVQKLVKQ